MVRSERKEREFNLRRSEILGTAEKTFAAKSFHDVTMAEIANASGFSTGSLYQFFKSKENLYTTMVSEKLDFMFTEVRKSTEQAEGLMGKIEMLIDTHLQFVEQNADFLLLFIKGEKVALSESMTSLHEKIMDGYYNHITFIENLLKVGIETGMLRHLPSRDMAEALFYLIRASSVRWMLMPTTESPRSKKGFILDIFLNGVKRYD
ncbi:transcriptional regulator, TetR family [Smithella sp. ME-1]|uniref:Transcriptional regulator, tetr family n=1 Tax=hydrocarbon metagenome TaxID=938273 RepID=A0A0W8FUT1_9ZZZZ|nr:transcriptional regulator, TetR family [Smithella sp. ME-1]